MIVQFVNREFKKLRRQLQGKRHIKIEVKSRDYSRFITLYKIGGVHFRLLGTKGFHVKAKNERLTAASSRCRQNLNRDLRFKIIDPTAAKTPQNLHT